jgi:hypothetical protein
MPIIPAIRSRKRRIKNLRPSQAKVTVWLKNKRAEGIAQVVECLSSMHKALDSIPSTANKEDCGY